MMSPNNLAQELAFLLLGPTGSGKTPLGEELEKRGLFGRRALHFDFGANLRRAAKDELPLPKEEKELIKSILAEGRLLRPEEFYLAHHILAAFMENQGFHSEHILILNGLPRNIFQAQNITSLIRITHVVYLEAEISILRYRLFKDPAGDRKARDDDSELYLQKKLAWFQSETLPLLPFYQERGAEVIKVKVEELDTGQTLYHKLSLLL